MAVFIDGMITRTLLEALGLPTMGRTTRGRTTFGDAFVVLPIVRVPRIEMFPLSESDRSPDGFVVGLVGELRGRVEPAQHVGDRRMHLTMHDDVARARTVSVHCQVS